MKLLKKSLLAASVGFLFLSSCKNSPKLNDSLVAIPRDAVSVTAINVPSLMQKADFESVKNMDFYKETISEAEKKNPAMAEIMKNPKKSGIDLTKNIYIVQDYDFAQRGDMSGGGSVLMSIADVKAFETMLQNAKAGDVQTKDGVKYIRIDKEKEETTEGGYKVNYHANGLVAWNDKMAVLGSQSGDDFLKYFKTKPDESVAQNDQIKSLLGSSHDIYTYMSLDKYADNMSAKAAAGAMNLDPKALKGNYLTGYSDFEKGQVVSKSDFKINKEITQQWGILFKNNVKTDFSKYINGQNLGFAMTMGLDMKGLKEIIKANPQFSMMTKMGENAYNLTIDDLCKALDGDIVIAASPNGKEDKWSGMMGFKVGDKPAIQKLMDVLVKEEILIKENENTFHFAGMAESLSKGYVNDSKVMFKDDVLFLGDNVTVSNLNTKGSVNSDVKDVLNKNIFGIYANFEKIFANTEGMKDPEMTEMKMSINGKSGESTLKMRDQSENSLKSLMKAANRWYLKNKAEEDKRLKESGEEKVKTKEVI